MHKINGKTFCGPNSQRNSITLTVQKWKLRRKNCRVRQAPQYLFKSYVWLMRSTLIVTSHDKTRFFLPYYILKIWEESRKEGISNTSQMKPIVNYLSIAEVYRQTAKIKKCYKVSNQMQHTLTFCGKVIQPLKVCIRKHYWESRILAQNMISVQWRNNYISMIKIRIQGINMICKLMQKFFKIEALDKRIYDYLLLIGVLKWLASWNRSIFTRGYWGASTQPTKRYLQDPAQLIKRKIIRDKVYKCGKNSLTHEKWKAS